MKRLSSSQQAIVYNILDTLPLDVVKTKVLNSCGVTGIHCDCKRLLKKSTQSSCPMIFKFTTSFDAKRFTKLQDHIRLHSSFKNVAIEQDKTMCQRRKRKRSSLASSSPLNKEAAVCTDRPSEGADMVNNSVERTFSSVHRSRSNLATSEPDPSAACR
ncbi:unnamed protein product [Heterobilharzia americana]|nr:unnamed protein product [Heterobilharzia americana]